MIDVVYPLGRGSKWSDNELRYSLRSLEKNFPDLGEVYVVGCRPAWLANTVHIPADDPLRTNKDGNIINKVLRACRRHELSEEFVFASDDQILLSRVSFQDVKPFYVSDLAKVRESWWGKGRWKRRMKRTYELLASRQRSTYHYDSHVLVPFNKYKFVWVMTGCNFEEGIGYTINTVYFNSLGLNEHHPIDGRKATFERACRDVGRIRARLEGKTYLGYNNAGLTPELKQVIKELFPHKSRFEK